MKAITYRSYGSPDVLELRDVDDPVPGDDEVLVRVHAASANPRDWHYVRGEPYFMRLQAGLRRPRKHGLGSDVAGRVEAVGKSVTQFRPGDGVLADVLTGGFAEYTCVPESLAVPKPAGVSFDAAASIPLAALTALQGLRNAGRIQPGQRVLVIGAGGGVGTFAVQLATWFGAEVTGVCSTRNVDLVRSLGAAHVVDYTRDDGAEAGDGASGGGAYDIVFQLAGTRSPGACRRLLAAGGTLVLSSGESDGRWLGALGRNLHALGMSPFVPQRLVPVIARRSREDLELVTGLVAAGTIVPVVDRSYPLADVPEAVRYLEEGHARGKVVITI